MSDCKCRTCGAPIVCQMGRPCTKCPGDPRRQSKKEYSFFKPGMFVRLKAGGEILRVIKVTEKASDALQEEDENKRCLLTCTGSTSNVIQCREDVVDEVSLRPWSPGEAFGKTILHRCAEGYYALDLQRCQIVWTSTKENSCAYVVHGDPVLGLRIVSMNLRDLLDSNIRQPNGDPCGVIMEDGE